VLQHFTSGEKKTKKVTDDNDETKGNEKVMKASKKRRRSEMIKANHYMAEGNTYLL
jgi:hypothetical protein